MLIIRWVALYIFASVWRRGESEKHTCSLASPGGVGRGDGHGRTQSVKIRPKASQARNLLLPFIFAMTPCIIHFDRDRPSRLRDAVTLGESSLYIRATTTEIATHKQSRKHQHILVSPLLLLRSRCYFIPFIDVYLRSGEQVSKTIILSDPASGEDE
jgi:hypothetical protein